jgi:hypothetical protein
VKGARPFRVWSLLLAGLVATACASEPTNLPTTRPTATPIVVEPTASPIVGAPLAAFFHLRGVPATVGRPIEVRVADVSDPPKGMTFESSQTR